MSGGFGEVQLRLVSRDRTVVSAISRWRVLAVLLEGRSRQEMIMTLPLVGWKDGVPAHNPG
jgi:hypothetical protein